MKMQWYDFLDMCEAEKILCNSFYVYLKYTPDAIRTGTYWEIAFKEFKYMWE